MKIKLCAFVSALLSLFCSELHAGNLKVNLAPAQAVSAGARWQVDGGSWKSSGATVKNLSNTTHQVTFKTVSGWLTPAPVTVSITNGTTTTLTATYLQPASLTVTLAPNTGQWRIDGGAWRSSGATVGGLSPSAHQVEYSSLAGYVSPATETVTLTSGQTTTLARSYTQLAQLSITLSPATALWRVDGGQWLASGATAPDLSPGVHTVDYSAENGYASPPAESVTLTAGQLLSITRGYVQLAQVTVTLTPGSAQWRVDGGTWLNSGTTAANLTPGNHTIDYASLAEYTTPASDSVTLVTGQSLALSRTYVPLPASLRVDLWPATATWRATPVGGTAGPWLAAGALLPNLSPGDYLIEYAELSGHVAPASETVTLTPNQNLEFMRAYTALASITVTLTPAQGQWRLDGGSWNASGSTLANLTAGDHLVEYSSLPDYSAPAAEIVTLTAGAAPALHRSYVADPAFAIVHVFDDAGNLPTAIRGSDGWIYYAASSGESNGLGVLYRMQPDGTQRELLLRFGFAPVTGTQPKALIEGSDGVLYGTTLSGVGGTSTVSNGTIYRVNRDGTGYATLYVVSGTNWGQPNSLLEGLDGALYGTTTATGASGANGKVFRINKDGSGFTVLHSLFSNEGSNPQGLRQVPSGALYGTARAGGSSGLGSIFKLNPDGSGFAVVKNFLGGPDGSGPRARLTLGSDGLLYGTTYGGGTAANRGLVFRINPDGSGYEVLRNFLGATADAFGPESALVEEPDGVLYGTTSGGGPANRGTIFRLNKDGMNYSVVCTFAGGIDDGAFPRVELVQLGAGRFLGGTHSFGGGSRGVFYTINADGTSFTTILQQGSPGGAEPWTPVTEADGVLYGVTHTGGSAASGVLFRVNPNGTGFTVLKSFAGSADGSVPIGALCAASDGLLYGTTYTNSKLFRIARDGTGFTILQDFSVAGLNTWSGVLEASDGVLYGTMAGGATSYGTVYRITKSGTGYMTLHTFTNATTDGGVGYGWLIEGADGRLYGTTYGGGTANQGIVYAINKDGSGFSILHHFAGGADGAQPFAGLTQTAEGTLFGTTTLGGAANRGTLFKLNPDGSGYAVIKSFTGGLSDGADPTLSGAIEKDGQLYGITTKGGLFDAGTIYRINKDGSGYEILVNFGLDDNDVAFPWANLTKGSDGNLYGTAARGPVVGSVFRLRVN